MCFLNILAYFVLPGIYEAYIYIICGTSLYINMTRSNFSLLKIYINNQI